MKRYPDLLGFSVSHTTRNLRPGEQHGINYYFVSDDEMRAAINNSEFLEHAFVHSHFYGTSYGAVKNIQNSGRICIIEIDVQGVQTMKRNKNFEAKYIFVSPPSIEDLEVRLKKRSTESEEHLKIRLENARKEIAYGDIEGNFDANLVNDTIDITVERLIHLLRAWYPNMSF